MNIPVIDHSTVKAHQQWPTSQKASEPADAVVADEVSFVKSHRRLLMIIGLLAGGLAVALMTGWSSTPAVKDPRVQSLRVEVVQAQAAGTNGRTVTGIVEARVQGDFGFRGGGKGPERHAHHV